MKTVLFPARIENLGDLTRFILDFLRENDFPVERIQDVELAAEEAVVNIIRHGFENREPGEVEIRCRTVNDDRVEVQLLDNGVEFDPLSMPQPDLNLPLSERKIGGLGVFLIRRLVNEVSYRRKGERNILTLVIHRRRGE